MTALLRCNMRTGPHVPAPMFRIPLFLICLIVLGASSLPAAAPLKLNFISIVTDDQASWSLGCYCNKECITPHMDRLAKVGARFVNAFSVTPVCSPCRITFMTGKYGAQMGITDYLAPNEEAAGL